jgi:hypothetical protein
MGAWSGHTQWLKHIDNPPHIAIGKLKDCVDGILLDLYTDENDNLKVGLLLWNADLFYPELAAFEWNLLELKSSAAGLQCRYDFWNVIANETESRVPCKLLDNLFIL